MTDLKSTVVSAFRAKYNEDPAYVVRAPGRVNLIGEHTDYNDGYVFPMAIDRAVWIALRPTDSPTVTVQSLDFDQEIHFDLNDFAKAEQSPAEYAKGMAWALQEAGYALNGWQGVMKGDVPIGSGLSSSAALELAIAQAFHQVSDFEWDASKMALLAQKAENQWLDLQTGIMDQMISASGVAGNALLIDCRSLDSELVPMPDDIAVVVLDTNTRRELVTSAYNERRQQCEHAAHFFGVEKLRDVTLAQFAAHQDELDALTRQRARHVITENDRVLQAKQALLNGDTSALGNLLNASHASLRDDFEVTNDALNSIVAIAQAQDGCYGARMTGAGFGGCAVALVGMDKLDNFIETVTSEYAYQTPHEATVYITHASNGAEAV